jgi:hypothetical protein
LRGATVAADNRRKLWHFQGLLATNGIFTETSKSMACKNLPYEEIQKGSSFLNHLCYVILEWGRNHLTMT